MSSTNNTEKLSKEEKKSPGRKKAKSFYLVRLTHFWENLVLKEGYEKYLIEKKPAPQANHTDYLFKSSDISKATCLRLGSYDTIGNFSSEFYGHLSEEFIDSDVMYYCVGNYSIRYLRSISETGAPAAEQASSSTRRSELQRLQQNQRVIGFGHRYMYYGYDENFKSKRGTVSRVRGTGQKQRMPTVYFDLTEEQKKLAEGSLVYYKENIVAIALSSQMFLFPQGADRNIATICCQKFCLDHYTTRSLRNKFAASTDGMKTLFADALFNESLKTLIDHTKRRLQQNVDSALSNLNTLASQYGQQLSDLNVARMQSESFTDTTVIDSFQKLRSFAWVKSISLDGSWIILHLKGGKIRVRRGLNVIGADFEVKIPTSFNMAVTKFFGKGFNINYPAPHYMGDGRMCFGNALTQVGNISSAANIEALAIWARTFFLSANLNDSAGRRWWRYPCAEVPEEAKWAEKNMSNTSADFSTYLRSKDMNDAMRRQAFLDNFFSKQKAAKKSA